MKEKINLQIKNQLILNPVENLPILFKSHDYNSLEGLYITDKKRTELEKMNSKILFGGRQLMIDEVLSTYEIWKQYLKADDITLRPFSGLNAHLMMFLSLGNIGDKVLLLPEKAGGHFATTGILKRLGYTVEFLPVNIKNKTVDIDKALKMIKNNDYKFFFIDRSEGINYEDFFILAQNFKGLKIFDASQYLTNILFNDFPSPFDIGFDIIISTLHKNFPGPQKALLCTNYKNNFYWQKIRKTLNECISNIHSDKIIESKTVLLNKNLEEYSHEILKNSVVLEKDLANLGLDVETKKKDVLPTHHIWIKFPNKEEAYKAYKNLENDNILVNYRLLPYELGYGLRLGTNATTLQGLTVENSKTLAKYIYQSINGVSDKSEIGDFILNMKDNSKYGNY